jgi:hypothetical protein
VASGRAAGLLGCVAAFLLLPGRTATASEGPDGDESVRITIALLDSLLRPGATGTLAATFVPAEDMHINATPAVEFTITSSKVFRLVGRPQQKVDERNGYLSLRGPVMQKFLLDNRARPGHHRIKGRLTYFYCSNSEGWCRKRVVSFERTVRVVR